MTAPQPSSSARSATLRLRSDAGLTRLVGRGDRQAFAVVYERYHQQLYRYCLSILREPEDASDALQSTMANALRALDERGRDVALRPWLFRIAHNEAVSVLRRRRSHEELSEEHAPAAGDVTTEARLRERLSELVSDLAELPSRQRGALIMRELSGLSYDDIAAVLEVSSAAAKQTVYEARRGLYEIDEGRSMECEHARHVLSARDGRLVRGRKVRAHLRHCENCRGFKEALATRPPQLAALAPPLETSTAAAVLASILGTGSQGGGTGGGLLAGLGGGGAAVPATGKLLAALTAVAAASTAAVAGVHSVRGGQEPAGPHPAPRAALVTAAPASPLVRPAKLRPHGRTRPRARQREEGSAPPPASSPSEQPGIVARPVLAVVSETPPTRSSNRRSGSASSSPPATNRGPEATGGDEFPEAPSRTTAPESPVSLPPAETGSIPMAGGAAPALPQDVDPPVVVLPEEVGVTTPTEETPSVPDPPSSVETDSEDAPVEAPDIPDTGGH